MALAGQSGVVMIQAAGAADFADPSSWGAGPSDVKRAPPQSKRKKRPYENDAPAPPPLTKANSGTQQKVIATVLYSSVLILKLCVRQRKSSRCIVMILDRPHSHHTPPLLPRRTLWATDIQAAIPQLPNRSHWLSMLTLQSWLLHKTCPIRPQGMPFLNASRSTWIIENSMMSSSN
jgi:hypothetical protein